MPDIFDSMDSDLFGDDSSFEQLDSSSTPQTKPTLDPAPKVRVTPLPRPVQTQLNLTHSADAIFSTSEASLPPAVAPLVRRELPSMDSSVRVSHKILPFGSKVKRYALDRLKFEENRREHLVILLDEVLTIRYHYVEGFGYVYCKGTVCCQVDGEPPVRYAIPVLRLIVDESKRITGGEPHVILVSEDTYDSLVEKSDDHGDLKQKIMKVRCSDTTFQKIEVDILPLDVESEAISRMLSTNRAYAEQHLSSLYRMFAREISEKDMEKLYEAGEAQDGRFTG